MIIPKEKRCFVCGGVKPIDDFYIHKQMTDGHLNKCKECTRKYMSSRQKDGLTKKIDWKRHHTNPDRYLKHRYYAIKNRCTSKYRSGGVGKKYHNSYYGLQYLTFEEWLQWCEQSKKTFMSLWVQWVESGYRRSLSPSIDRIDNSKGYILGNLQWLTTQGNSNKYLNERYGKERKVF